MDNALNGIKLEMEKESLIQRVKQANLEIEKKKNKDLGANKSDSQKLVHTVDDDTARNEKYQGILESSSKDWERIWKSDV